MSKEYFSQLQSIIEKGIKNNPLPIKKGNSIRIGKTAIRASRCGYLVFDVEEKVQVEQLLSLRGALAYTRLYNKDKDIKHVKSLDKQYNKFYNDAQFYQKTVDTTKEISRKLVAETRLEIAYDDLQQITKSLERIIFDNK